MQPVHYTQGPVHCIDAMMSAFGRDAVIVFCQLNAFKYVWRCTTHADGNVANLQKAVWYMQKAMELCSAATGNK